MSDWNNNSAYNSQYTEYYQTLVPSATSRFDQQSGQKYTDFQYTNLEHSQYGHEQNPPYAQGQMMAGDLSYLPSRSSTKAYENRYIAPVVTLNHLYAIDQGKKQQNADLHTDKNVSRSKYPQIAKKPSGLTTQIPSDQPTGYVATVPSNSQTSKPQMKDIGTVCYNEETQEYRYKCDLEGCTRKSMGRVQDLKRHYDDLHGGMMLECPVAGCKHTRARRDKLIKHCREAHGSEYGY